MLKIRRAADFAAENGLHMDHLSSHRFLANGHKLMTHMLAYALYVLFREANEKTPEVNKMEVGTAQTRLFKVGALVQATHRHIWFKVASHWPGATLLIRAATPVRPREVARQRRQPDQAERVGQVFVREA